MSFGRLLCRAGAFAAVLFLPVSGVAQSNPTGAVSGRIINPATGQYVRNAQVRVEPGGHATVSEDGGVYRLRGIAPGDATVTVVYTGYPAATATVNVTAGGEATRDIELVAAPARSDTPLRLDAFVVSSDREGNAKAIMEQRNSMNITNSVASDVFGDVAEGNVGEFLKHMPGVEIDLVEGEIRTVRLRGLDSEYTQVTLDGVSLASADANQGASGNARAFSFEQVSLSSMDSIEVSKTISADVDANAPAGTINLKTKRAFDRSGRRVSAQANATAFSTRFNFDESHGPDDRRSAKIHPGGIFDYSDVFFHRRLGINLNVSESMAYSANARATMTYNYTPTTADPRPAVLTGLSFTHAPRTNRRSTVNFTSDFRATPRLVLSLGLLYNYADLNNPQRTLAFNTGARNTVIGADPLISFRSSAPTASVVSNPAAIVKLGQTLTALPKFEYRLGEFTLEGKFSFSNSISWYDPRNRRGSVRDTGSPTLAGLTWEARRSALNNADWHITQVAGPDMANGANFTTPIITLSDGRYARTDIYGGEVVAHGRTRRVLPVTWKAGVKSRLEVRDFRLDTESLRTNYTGPGAAAVGAFAGYKSPYDYDIGALNNGARLHSVSGGTVWVPDLVRLGTLAREHPDYFTPNVTATNYYNAFIGNRRNYEERIDGAFVMGTASVGPATVRAGLRREDTHTDALEFDPRTAAEIRAAGFNVVAGRATTIPGLQYQYFSKPRVHRKGSYDSLFPSASLKYRITPQLDAQFGFSSTIRRPTFRDLAGVWTINDEAFTVTAPNPQLTPETSRNYSARLAYYFEPVGIFAVNAFQNSVKGLFSNDRLTAAEFGYSGDLDLSAYEFITTSQSVNRVVVRGMEYEYSQSLSFLPEPFRGLNVRASYTRNYAEIKKANMIPHSLNAGVSYAYRRASAYANLTWRDDYPTTVTGNPRFYRHRTNLDIGGSYRFNARYSAFFSARNIFNEPYIVMEQVGANPAAAQFYQVIGTNWTFGIKGVW